ncbi:hypothetical protein ONZ45_g6672 [Pleurotus djamor]|nr:hypothetical protein ONZ45_g6672 [Pleurotus djamor]
MTLPGPERLTLLCQFCSDLWGAPLDKVHKQEPAVLNQSQTQLQVSFLDLTPYLAAMHRLWPDMESKILIRQEYIDALAYLKDRSAEAASGCVILGQPGIGKTLFLIYVLIDRLRSKEPVALQMLPGYYLLFDDRQVTAHPSDDHNPFWKREREWKHPIWMLSNTSDRVQVPCDAFRFYTGYIVQASSPSEAHWKGWLKERMGFAYVMDVPSPPEMASIAHILNLDQAKCANIVSLWGPSIRIMVTIARRPAQEEQHQRAARSAAARLAMHPTLLGQLTSPSFDNKSLSSLIVFVRPHRDRSGHVNRAQPSPWIPTQYLVELMAKDLQKVTADIPCTWKGLAPPEHLPDALKPAPAIFCKLEEVSLNEPFYWRPNAPNFPGIDGVLFDGKAVYAIQATVALSRKHSTIETGLKEVKKQLPAAFRNGLFRVIFAAVDEEKMISLMNGEKLQDVPIGGCVVSLDSSQPLLFPGRKFDAAERGWEKKSGREEGAVRKEMTENVYNLNPNNNPKHTHTTTWDNLSIMARILHSNWGFVPREVNGKGTYHVDRCV